MCSSDLAPAGHPRPRRALLRRQDEGVGEGGRQRELAGGPLVERPDHRLLGERQVDHCVREVDAGLGQSHELDGLRRARTLIEKADHMPRKAMEICRQIIDLEIQNIMTLPEHNF